MSTLRESREWREYRAIPGLEVTESGGVRRYYKNKWTVTGWSITPRVLRHETDKDGNKYVNTKDHGRLMVAELVATCYWGRPRDGKEFIIHKDGNKDHCWKSNLMWATSYEYGEHYKNDPNINTPDGYRLVTIAEKSGKVYVSKDGKVRIDGNDAKIRTECFDSDVEYDRPVLPHVNVYRKDLYGHAEYVDRLVATAFMPMPKGMNNPQILHKNNDYMDCTLNNLEWVPFNDQRYQDYIAIRTKDIDAKDKANRENALKERNYWREQYNRNDSTSINRADIPDKEGS